MSYSAHLGNTSRSSLNLNIYNVIESLQNAALEVLLTRIIVTQIFPFATILLALGSQIGFYRTVITGLENEAENLLSCPECYRLRKIK